MLWLFCHSGGTSHARTVERCAPLHGPGVDRQAAAVGSRGPRAQRAAPLAPGRDDARGLYREQAYTSMFEYAVQALHMSEAQAYLRIQVARLGRQFPAVLESIGSGDLHLTAIKLLGPHLTLDNHVQVLERARGKSKREVEQLVAEIAPKPDVPNRLRKLPQPRGPRTFQLQPPGSMQATDLMARVASNVQADDTAAPSSPSLAPNTAASATSASESAAAHAMHAESPGAASVAANRENRAFVLQPPPSQASCSSLSPSRYKLQLTVGQALHDKLDQLQELLRHRLRNGDLATIVELAVDELLDKTMKQRFAGSAAAEKSPRARTAAPDEPRADESSARKTAKTANAAQSRVDCAVDRQKRVEQSSVARHRVEQSSAAHSVDQKKLGVPASRMLSRYVPRSVLREVYARDGGQCTFVSADGRRCAARGLLEIHHHDTPYARGGAATVDNLRLMCRVHNGLQAERDYSRAFMVRKLRQVRGARASHNA